MTIALQKPVTMEEFLAREQRNMAVAIGGRLRGKPCEFIGSDLKVEVAGRIRYPDGFVVRSPGPDTSTVVHDPVMIFEVLSAATSGTDRITKNQGYRATPAVLRYVILEQGRIAATVFTRVGADWTGEVLAEDALPRMPETGMELTLKALYEGVDFAAADIAESIGQ
jgi:Uma2 family endonuclease